MVGRSAGLCKDADLAMVAFAALELPIFPVFFAAALLEVYVSCCSFCWTLILLERIKIGMLGLA